MDERYANSLLDSIKTYVYNLEYLGTNDKVTLRALSTFKILHQLYNWADWFEVSEEDKIKMEQLMNCIILRNSSITLPTIVPGTYYSNVSTPQTIFTWQRVYDDPNVQIHEDLTPVDQVSYYLAVQSTNGGTGVPITVSRQDLTGQTNGTTAFLRTYLSGGAVRLTAPTTLASQNTFSRWRIDGINQPLGTLYVDINMTTSHTAIAIYDIYVPELGSITIEKTVVSPLGADVADPTLFEITITDGNTTATGFVKKDNPITFNNLPFGTYTVSEAASSLHNLVSIVTSPVVLNSNTPNKTVVINNAQKAPIGTITINKVILLESIADPTDLTSFPIQVTDGTTTFTGNVTQATPLVFTNVPFGTFTITETNPLYYQLENTIKLTVTVTVENPNQSITITNIHSPIVGSITVSKVVKEGEVVDPNDTSVFTVTISDGINSLWVGTTSVGNPYTFDNLPVGTYTITESALNGYELVSITPASVIITTENLVHTVEIINNKLSAPETGTITINKRVQDYTDIIKYGILYNWYAVADTRNITSAGWHVSTEQDWADLQAFVIETYPLIETGSSHWAPAISSATNATGFTARPSGYRAATGTYGGLGTTAQYWTSREASASEGSMFFISNSPLFGYVFLDKRYGGAVRIVKDSTTLTNGQIGTYIGNDGKVYKTICIGTTEWIIDNLVETKFRDGSVVPVVASGWTNLGTAGMCYYNNDISNSTYRGIGLVADNTTFEVSINNGTLTTKNVTYSLPANFTTLPFGNYTITETALAGYGNTIISNPTITLSELNLSALVTVTNTKIPSYGSITVNKTILNSSMAVPNTIFDFQAIGSGVNPLIFIQSGKVGTPIVFANLPLDTYTIVEVDDPDYSLVSITPSSCTLTSGTPNQEVAVVNDTLTPTYGHGLLYNWWAATDKSQISSSDDWILPSVGDYTNLGTSLGGLLTAGGKMKLPGYTYFISPNTGASNTSGFNGVGAGIRAGASPSNFEQELAYTVFWTTNEFDADNASLIALGYATAKLVIDQFPSEKYGLSKNTGSSIRLRRKITTLSEGETSTYIGNDKQIYHTICIGGIEWLAENLKETKYRTGTTINNVTDGEAWATLRTGAMCAYNNDLSKV